MEMQKKQPSVVIGPTTSLDVLEFGIKNVPAKVDTGADSSAIWASNVYEHEGVLFFTLFGAGSPFYTGETHQTKEYTKSLIKNSFGQTEERYKVKLKVSIAGKVINANFTLANRAANKFPVLIGRRTMHGRFIIDVSRETHNHRSGVLVLCSKEIKSVNDFFSDMQKQNPKLQITVATYDNLEFTISDKGTSIKLADSGKDIADFAVVYFKTFSLAPDFAAAVAQYLERRNVPFFDKAVKLHPATSKLLQYVLLQENGVPVPDSIFLPSNKLPDAYSTLKEKLGVPFILKDIHENKGRYNYLVKNQKEFKSITAQMKDKDLRLIAQKFIPNKGDYRLVAIGGRAEIIMLRSGKEGTHLNNTAREAEATLVSEAELPREVIDQALFGAELLGFSIAGADFVQDNETTLWYCLEINDAPQLASGAFVDKKQSVVAEFLRKKANIN